MPLTHISAKIEHENQLLMKKIYHIMTDKVGENAREYLPGVRITKNQAPTVDCHVNLKTRTNIPGKAVMQKSLNFEAWERKYNRHVEENQAMMGRLKARKPVYSRVEWSKFAVDQKKYSENARNPDLTAGHLPKNMRLSKKSLMGLSALHNPMTPGSYKNEMVRSRSAHSSVGRKHRRKQQESASVIVEADTTIDQMPCVLKISELCTSFHDKDMALTHGTSGLLVEATTEGGSVYGEASLGIKDLQGLVKNAMRDTAEDGGMSAFSELKAFEGRADLFPTFETALSSEEEMKVAEVAMANVYVSNVYTAGGKHLKVTVGHRHTAQINH